MTYLHLPEREIHAGVWGYDTLRPPALTPGNLARDLLWELHQFRKARLNLATALAFLVLRLIQRSAYNLGWREG